MLPQSVVFGLFFSNFWWFWPNFDLSRLPSKFQKQKIVTYTKQNHKVDVMYMIVGFMVLIDLIPQLLLMGITLAFVKK